MMKKIKEYTFYEDLYETNISYIFGGSVDEFVKLIRDRHKDAPMFSWGEKFAFEEDANTTNAYQFHINGLHGDGEKFYVYILTPYPSLLYHETFHLAGDILFTRGARYVSESEECYAYLGSWIFEKIFTKLNGKLVLRA
jgi:hypothetical protein